MGWLEYGNREMRYRWKLSRSSWRRFPVSHRGEFGDSDDDIGRYHPGWIVLGEHSRVFTEWAIDPSHTMSSRRPRVYEERRFHGGVEGMHTFGTHEQRGVSMEQGTRGGELRAGVGVDATATHQHRRIPERVGGRVGVLRMLLGTSLRVERS